MIACGDYYVLPAPGLLHKILESLYLTKCSANLDEWRKYWETDYNNCLKTQPLHVVKGMISAVNPILAKINKNAVIYMLSTVLDSSSTTTLKDKNSLWIFVSFLKVAREKNLILDGEDGSFTLSGTSITISRERLEKLILNKDRNIIANVLDFISCNPKPSELPSKLEFDLLLLFLKYGITLYHHRGFSFISFKNITGTRTSYPDYRKDLMSSFKRFIERLRLVYERDIHLVAQGKSPKKKNY